MVPVNFNRKVSIEYPHENNKNIAKTRKYFSINEVWVDFSNGVIMHKGYLAAFGEYPWEF